jgi:drug/metabolite transporter superfamily protein YnfA
MQNIAWFIFIASAILEVGGDAVIRKGLRGGNPIIMVMGFIMLGCYGLIVNTVRWDFSKLLGVYVAVFALVSLMMGRIVFKENIPVATWIGMMFIVGGGLTIQFGNIPWP